ncbi:MAG: SMP-30/gluconolactonase/LRE family protein [Opitutales bacterium]
MFSKSISLLAAIIAIPSFLIAQDSVNFPSIGEVLRFDDKMDTLVADGVEIEVLSSGFAWSEGPVWVKEGNFLLFSDVHRNKVIKWTEGIGAEIFLEPSGFTGIGHYSRGLGSNGLAIDSAGRLISCEHGDRRISSMTFNEGKVTLADNYNGKRFNSPNDLVISKEGRIYFTDPIYGLPLRWDDPTRELDYAGVFLLGQDGSVSLLTKELKYPNGVELSPDEKTLYVAQSDPDNPIVMAYPIEKDGTTGKGKLLFDAKPHGHLGGGNPDGLKVDRNGNLWITGMGGVMVVSSKGRFLGQISTGELTANCAWGGDGSVLYITADTYLCRIQTQVKGRGF